MIENTTPTSGILRLRLITPADTAVYGSTNVQRLAYVETCNARLVKQKKSQNQWPFSVC
jgi:hypothetical protein